MLRIYKYKICQHSHQQKTQISKVIKKMETCISFIKKYIRKKIRKSYQRSLLTNQRKIRLKKIRERLSMKNLNVTMKISQVLVRKLVLTILSVFIDRSIKQFILNLITSHIHVYLFNIQSTLSTFYICKNYCQRNRF